MKNTIQSKKQNKNDFISKLAAMSPEEVNTFIKEKGKQPKLMKPFQKVMYNPDGTEMTTGG